MGRLEGARITVFSQSARLFSLTVVSAFKTAFTPITREHHQYRLRQALYLNVKRIGQGLPTQSVYKKQLTEV